MYKNTQTNFTKKSKVLAEKQIKLLVSKSK